MTGSLQTKTYALDRLYRELPGIDCKRLCQESCGPIAMSDAEAERIVKKLKYRPVVRQRALCPMLKDGLCSVYAIRPIICRIWGLVEEMRCPHGCEPERWLTYHEGLVLIARVHVIGAATEEDAARDRELLANLEADPEYAEVLRATFSERCDTAARTGLIA